MLARLTDTLVLQPISATKEPKSLDQEVYERFGTLRGADVKAVFNAYGVFDVEQVKAMAADPKALFVLFGIAKDLGLRPVSSRPTHWLRTIH